jgi:hypothetical protein
MNRQMSERHEMYLVRLFGGRRMKASGATQSGQMDGRLDAHRQAYAFAWDGKSTLGGSIGVSRKMWAKAVAQSHFERPMLCLRFYANIRLQDSEALDLAVVDANDLAEVVARLNELEAYIATHTIRNTSTVKPVTPPD